MADMWFSTLFGTSIVDLPYSPRSERTIVWDRTVSARHRGRRNNSRVPLGSICREFVRTCTCYVQCSCSSVLSTYFNLLAYLVQRYVATMTPVILRTREIVPNSKLAACAAALCHDGDCEQERTICVPPQTSGRKNAVTGRF